MTDTVTVFKSGNSKVVTIPASFPVKVGDRLKFSHKKKTITFLKAKNIIPTNQKLHPKTVKVLSKLIMTPNRNITLEEIEKITDSMYDD